MPKIDINLLPSKLFIELSILLLILSTLILFLLPLSNGIKFILLIAMFFYFLSIILKYGLLRHPTSILRVALSDEDWTIWDHKKVYAAELCGSSTITKTICVLRFKVLGVKQKKSCIILKDSLGEEVYKKVLMKIHCS